MELLQSWKKSLTFFLPRNFISLFVSSIKLALKALIAWFKKFWWLPIWCFGAFWFFVALRLGPWALILIIPILLLILFTLFATVILTSRKKALTGFWKYFFHWLVLFVIPIIATFSYGLFKILYKIEIVRKFKVDYFWYLLPFPFVFLFLIYSILFIFFLLDAKEGLLPALWKSCKMLLFNLPFCFVLSIPSCFIFVGSIIGLLIALVGLELGVRGPGPVLILGLLAFFLFLLYLLFICILANFYIKRRQENPRLR